jgi:hypothetical protein
VVKMFLQSSGWFAAADSIRKSKARLPPFRPGDGQVESPGDDVLKQRKLHERRQCLHSVCLFCRPVSPGRTRTLAERVLSDSSRRKQWPPSRSMK